MPIPASTTASTIDTELSAFTETLSVVRRAPDTSDACEQASAASATAPNQRQVSSLPSFQSAATSSRKLHAESAMVARPSARSVPEALYRSAAPAAAVALNTAKPRLVPIVRPSVSSKSPLRSAPTAVSAATQRPATSAQPRARRTPTRRLGSGRDIIMRGCPGRKAG